MRPTHSLRLALGVTLALLAVPMLAGDSIPAGKGKIEGVLISGDTQKPLTPVELVLLLVERVPNSDEVKVKLFFIDDQFPRVTTDQSGRFSFRNLPNGLYAITLSPIEGLNRVIKDEEGYPRVFELTQQNSALDLGNITVRLRGREQWGSTTG